jgi:hypothetical protein
MCSRVRAERLACAAARTSFSKTTSRAYAGTDRPGFSR